MYFYYFFFTGFSGFGPPASAEARELIVPLPNNKTFYQWVMELSTLNGLEAQVVIPASDEQLWKRWVFETIAPDTLGVPLPDPRSYNDWQDWVRELSITN
jgi:hypothetical protein